MNVKFFINHGFSFWGPFDNKGKFLQVYIVLSEAKKIKNESFLTLVQKKIEWGSR